MPVNARLGQAFSISDKAFTDVPVDTGQERAGAPGAGSSSGAHGPDDAAVEPRPLDPGRRIYENLRALRDAGFSHIHLSYKWRSPHPMTAEELGIWERALERTGMKVLDVHGIHSRGVNLWDPDDEGRARALELFRHRLEVTARLGGDAMVYHVPTRVEPTPELVARFLDGLARMEEVAARLGVYVALENHFLRENDRVVLPACFERFSPDYIRFTFDTGHAMISGNLSWLAQECVERLHILHLHDNDGVEDRHWLPMEEGGTVNWDLVADVIARSPYEKPVQLEVRWDKERYPAHGDFLAAAHAACRRITRSVEEARGLRAAEA